MNYVSHSDKDLFYTHKRVVVWDERPEVVAGMRCGGDYRLWTKGVDVRLADSCKYRYMPVIKKFSERKKIVAFDRIAHVVLNAMSDRSLLASSNVGYIPTLNEYLGGERTERVFVSSRPEGVKVRDKRMLQRRKRKEKHKMVLCVVCELKDFQLLESYKDVDFFHLPTNVFLDPDKDNRVALSQVKMVDGVAIQWSGDPILTSNQYGMLELETYQSNMLKEKDGHVCGPGMFRFEFVWSPDRIKRMESVNGSIYRVVFLRTDGQYSYYQLTSEFCYVKDDSNQVED